MKPHLRNTIKFLPLLLVFLLPGCTGLPEGVTPVNNFELSRFSGTWYEIARLDHSFEEGLSKVSANYSMAEDATVKVVNKGFNADKNQWSEAQGKAKFVGSEDIGHLKVSFFGPFYSSYIVFKLDHKNYQYAYVAGYNHNYLWLLARTKTVSDTRKQDFINTAKAKGFDVQKLIFVEH